MGTPLEQKAPWASLTTDNPIGTEKAANKGVVIARGGAEPERYELPITHNDVQVEFELDQRHKGLL